MIKKAYKFRFYPTAEQTEQLAHTFGCVRFVYNWALRLRSDAWYNEQKRIGYHESSSSLTALKKNPEYFWLNDISCVPTQQTLRHLQTGFKNFWDGRAKYPTFKKKHAVQSAEYTRSAFKWVNGQLTLAKHKEPLNIRWSRDIPDKPTTVTVTKDCTGRYFVSLLCDADVGKLPVSPNTVGIDLGIKDAVVTSDGWKSGNPRYTYKNQAKLAKYQRRLSKKQKGSANFHKAKLKVARVHAKIADSRKDFLHKLTTTLIHENQVISAESLQVKNMVKNPKLAKAISDVGWGEFIRQLQYKADWYGRTLVSIDKWYPSTKRCSHCGYTLKSLDLSVRSWECPECRTVHDRDTNAAVNIKAAGLAVLACGA